MHLVWVWKAFCAFPSRCIFLVSHVHCLKDPQVLFFSKNNFKTRSHNTIHTFKNYFTTVFLIFSNKQYPNRPLILLFFIVPFSITTLKHWEPKNSLRWNSSSSLVHIAISIPSLSSQSLALCWNASRIVLSDGEWEIQWENESPHLAISTWFYLSQKYYRFCHDPCRLNHHETSWSCKVIPYLDTCDRYKL